MTWPWGPHPPYQQPPPQFFAPFLNNPHNPHIPPNFQPYQPPPMHHPRNPNPTASHPNKYPSHQPRPPPPPPQFFAPFQNNPHNTHIPPHLRPYPPQPVVQQRHPPNQNPTPRRPDNHSSRDLAIAQDTARRLGTALPGDAPEEVRRWVEARRKNWPSRANVQRKLEEVRMRREAGAEGMVKEKGQGALANLANYASSDDDGGKGEEVEKGGSKRRRGKRRGRGRGRGKGGVAKVNVRQEGTKRRPTLLTLLLEEEISHERSVLLQAFRYLIKQRQREIVSKDVAPGQR